MMPEGYLAWRDRALGLIAAERPDVRKLLFWAESQPQAIGLAEEQAGAGADSLEGDAARTSYKGETSQELFSTSS